MSFVWAELQRLGVRQHILRPTFTPSVLLCCTPVYVVLAPIPAPFREYIVYTVVLVVSVWSMFYFARSAALKTRPWVRLYFASYFLMILSGLCWLFIDRGTILMLGFAILLFMIRSNALLLSKKYSDAFTFVEETNTNLEQLIDEQTHDMQQSLRSRYLADT